MTLKACLFQLRDSLPTCTGPGSLRVGVLSGLRVCSVHLSSYHHWSLALDLLPPCLSVRLLPPATVQHHPSIPSVPQCPELHLPHPRHTYLQTLNAEAGPHATHSAQHIAPIEGHRDSCLIR